ncbi:MAG: hypothetical protein ABIR96_09480 [Bdellovibrionota bacterium]
MMITTHIPPLLEVLSPRQGEGPFYPVIARHEWPETSLLHSVNATLPAHERLRLRICVVGDTPQVPLRVEVWHASREGRYRHPRDPQWTRLWDPDFLGYAQQTLNGSDSVDFYTCLPGIYWDPEDGPRPRHVHLKFRDESGNEIYTTQIYFSGDRLNAFESSLERLKPLERAELSPTLHWNQPLKTWTAEFVVRVGIRLPR